MIDARSITRTSGQQSEFASCCGSLLDRCDVHRIAVTIDPQNLRSKRLVERLGFRHEGRAIQAVFSRGTWRDDDLYALLRIDRQRSLLAKQGAGPSS